MLFSHCFSLSYLKNLTIKLNFVKGKLSSHCRLGVISLLLYKNIYYIFGNKYLDTNGKHQKFCLLYLKDIIFQILFLLNPLVLLQTIYIYANTSFPPHSLGGCYKNGSIVFISRRSAYYTTSQLSSSLSELKLHCRVLYTFEYQKYHYTNHLENLAIGNIRLE